MLDPFKHDSLTSREASFVIGRRGQRRGGAIVGEGPFELHPSDEIQHVSFSLLGRLLRVLVLDGGRRRLGLVVSAVARSGGVSLGNGGLLLLLLEQLLFLLLVQVLQLILLLLIQILLMLMLQLRLLVLKLLLKLLLLKLLLLMKLLLLILMLLLLLLLNLQLLVVLQQLPTLLLMV